jgi:STE24 endopeptidase
MNAYGIVILLALLADYLLHTVSDVLNVAELGGRVPDDIASLYGEEGLDRSRDYVRVATREAVIERSASLLGLLLFWFLGGFSWLDSLARPLFDGELARGLAYIGALALAYAALSIPFEAHRTFGIESRFGFNRTTWSTFVADRAKGLALGVILGGALLSGVLLLFLNAGDRAWLLCWLMVVAFSLVVQWLGPAVILPLFNRFEPMPDGELRDAIVRYADSVRFPLQNVYLIDGSRRSTRANAYFTGLGRRRRIALFDTLVQKHSTEEIVAVLAHEVGHYRLRHVTKGLVFGAAHAGVALFLLSLLVDRSGLHQALFVTQPSLYVGLVGFILLYTPIETVLSVLANFMSRRHEFAADRFAVDTAPKPGGLADALKILSVVNLTHPNPHRFHVVLNYSHPPLVQRLRAIGEHITAKGTA